MYQVRKRSGELELFELAKIKSAIQRTFEACERNYQPSIIETLSLKALALAERKVKKDILSVEDIQDSVEAILMNVGYDDVAKAYILYRKQHERNRNAKNTLLDYKKTIEGYTHRSDWRVKENASIDYSLGGLILGNSGAVTANYWLSEIYDDEIANAHRNCDIHIHDLSMLSAYCNGGSLRQLIKEGLGGVPKKIASKPASHLSTLCNQIVNFMGVLSLEFAGAQALSSIDTLLAPFVKVDNLSYREVKQCIQSLVFGLNTPSRWGCLKLSTQVATPIGFKYCDELSVGDEIYTWVDGTLHTAKLNHIIRKKNESGKLHKYIGKSYVQTVTPDHRCIVLNRSKRCGYDIKHSSEIFNSNKDLTMVDGFVRTNITGSVNLSNEEIMLAAMYYCDGLANTYKRIEITKSSRRDTGEIKRVLDHLKLSYTLEQYDKFSKSGELFFTNRYHIDSKHRDYIDNLIGYKYKIDDKFLNMSTEQSKLFIETWAKFDGSINGRLMCQYDNDEIRDALEIIMIRAGYLPHVWSRKKKTDKYPTNYVFAGTRQSVKVLDRKELEYDGDVWCPSTDDGTAIYRDIDGNIFISGNCQPPFTNFTLDWTVPDDLANLNCIVGGKELDFCYKDCKREMDMINKAFLEVMVEGDANGRSFSYPILTYSITKEFDWDPEIPNNKLLFEMTAKYGIPYFSNYVNSDMNPSDTRSMCCRLRLDLRELRRKNGGYFGSGDQTGSVGVCTINMPRLAYKSENESEFYKNLEHLMDICSRSLEIKRSVVSQLLDEGMYPYTKRYLGTFDNHFSTIATNGMNEMCLNAKWIRDTIASKKGYQFAKDVLDFMRNKLSDYQEKTGNLYNLESAPAESVCHRFAMHDKKDFPDIITAGDKTDGAPYYTNSSNLPVDFTDDIFEALDHQDELQTKYTGGTVFHAFLGEKLPNWQSAMNLTRKIAENYKLPYFTFSPTYSICQDHGYLTGEQWTCPHCGKPTEVYSRITGYYRAVQNFNDGKAHEFKDRKEYSVLDRKSFNTAIEVKDDPELKETQTIIKPLLFTTSTCPNCKIVKKLLDDYGFDYDIIVADNDMETVRAFDINQAPTLVVNSDSGLVKIANVSNIKKFLDGLKTDE